MKLPNAAEAIEKLAKEQTTAYIYIKAMEAKQASKSLDDFIEELRAMIK